MKTTCKVILLFLILFLAGCTQTGGSTAEPGGETPDLNPPAITPGEPTATPGIQDPLANTRWNLVSFGPVDDVQPVIPGSEITLEFGNDRRAGGNGGCNSYGANYEVSGNMLTLGPIESTLVACVDQAVMQQEGGYFQALSTAGEYEISGDQLQISYDNDQGLLNFVPSGSEGTQPTSAASGVLCSSTEEVSDSATELCRSQDYGFEIEFPQEGDLVDQTASSARINLPIIPNTNLQEKFLDITVTENGGNCSSPLAEGYEPGTIPAEPVEINGVEFVRETGHEGAAGSVYEWVAYSTSREGACISLSFVLHSTNLGMYSTPPPLFDSEAESQVFEEIVSTFRWQ
jgi:heat shock protein HslJ